MSSVVESDKVKRVGDPSHPGAKVKKVMLGWVEKNPDEHPKKPHRSLAQMTRHPFENDH